MKLPKLYSPVKIQFWSLRHGVGEGLGVTFDNDEKVIRIACRVVCENSHFDGWK